MLVFWAADFAKWLLHTETERILIWKGFSFPFSMATPKAGYGEHPLLNDWTCSLLRACATFSSSSLFQGSPNNHGIFFIPESWFPGQHPPLRHHHASGHFWSVVCGRTIPKFIPGRAFHLFFLLPCFFHHISILNNRLGGVEPGI